MAPRLTVTQLKCAVLDPEWRRRWLAGEHPSTFVYSNIGNGQVFGTRFHQETERLAKWLTNPKHLAEGAAIVSVQGLLDILWRSSLQTFTDELLAAGKPDEALDFTARIRNYCERLIELRKRRKDFDNWQDVFVCAEEEIKGVQLPIGPTVVEVVGRVDAVRFHPKYHLEVVDYKLSQGTQQKLDMVQLAIYAHLLPLWRPGCSFCGTLEYYLPNFMEISVSPKQLADIYVGLVEPVLYEMFAKGSKPAPATPKSNPALATPERDRLHTTAEASAGSDLATKVVEAFGEFNLSVEAMGVVQGPQVTRIKLKPAPGVKVSSLETRAADLRVKLALDTTPLIEPGKGFVAIDLPRANRQTLVLHDYLQERKPDKKSLMTFPVGVGVDGETIVSDFSDSNTCHILVAGTSGSGKSEWLKTLVASLALGHPSEHIRFALVDPKILTFGGIKDSPYLWKPIATDIESALAILGAAAAEMDSRYHVLARHGHVSLSERFQAGMIDLPFVILVFDEFADLILTGRNEKKEFEETVARIAGKGRAAGIHLVLATQRPDRTVVTGLIKSNLPMKVCLRVTNATNSLIVLGEAGAESLLGKGDLLCDLGKGIVRAQSYFIPQTEFAAALGA
jgi:S-DNA-T family DNA segregation ATPase FtsK/SpoIIIE